MRRDEESYWDIVWRQFKKNRFARWSLHILAALFLIAIGAPLLASNLPFVYRDGTQTLFPWFRGLFNPAEKVDFLFNMALLALLPSAVIALALNRSWKRREVPGRRRAAMAACIFLGFIVVLALLFGPLGLSPANSYAARTFPLEEFESRGKASGFYPLIPFGPTEQDIDALYKPPFYRKPAEIHKESNDGFVHILGTDNTGQDVLARMIYGTRISLTVGFVAVGLYVTIGVILGALAGYFGGWVDILISRVIEIVLLFPSFFLILTLVALIGPSIYIVMVVIGITGWPTVARLIRGEVLKQRNIEYATAAYALGSSHLRILFRHILPNALSPAMVAAPFGIAGAIITEGGLSLLGYGVRPPTPSWGTLLNLAVGNYNYWWLVVVPSVAIFLTVTVFNLVGNGLRDAMDPRMRM